MAPQPVPSRPRTPADQFHQLESVCERPFERCRPRARHGAVCSIPSGERDQQGQLCSRRVRLKASIRFQEALQRAVLSQARSGRREPAGQEYASTVSHLARVIGENYAKKSPFRRQIGVIVGVGGVVERKGHLGRSISDRAQRHANTPPARPSARQRCSTWWKCRNPRLVRHFAPPQTRYTSLNGASGSVRRRPPHTRRNRTLEHPLSGGWRRPEHCDAWPVCHERKARARKRKCGSHTGSRPVPTLAAGPLSYAISK